MLSLAPFLYRNVFAEDGGPIEQIKSFSTPIFGSTVHHATALLKLGLKDKGSWGIYGNEAGGSGSSKESLAIAQHKAISEALERWAYADAIKSVDRASYGFDHDRSSNGMCAFPGFKWQARRGAYTEALERWALMSWWDGRLKAALVPSPYANVGLVRIEHGQSKGEVVILFYKSTEGHWCYGHASGKTVVSAAEHAASELQRSSYVLKRHFARETPGIPNFLEKRLLHFATEQGHAEFLARLQTPPDKPTPAWRTIFDGEIKGPWSQWATVWRHCVEMPTLDFIDPEKRFFFW